MLNLNYNEIKKKNGQKVVFCKIEELLIHAFEVNTAEELQGFKTCNDEYICHCPFCKEEGHTKHKLYVKSDMSVGHCFVCTRSFINVTDEVDTSFQVPEFYADLYSSDDLEVVKLTDSTWTLDKFSEDFEEFDQAGYNYLIGRHKFMDQLYKILGFKFMDGNIVMPFKYRGEVFYYQIRFSGNSKIKYFFPPISHKPPYVIEHGENKKFIICEGVFDAAALLIQAPSFTPFAVLGSSISDYQLKFLREYMPEEILIYMDETEISKRIANKISSVIDYCPIRIIKSNGTDPEENLISLLKYNRNLQWIKSYVES